MGRARKAVVDPKAVLAYLTKLKSAEERANFETLWQAAVDFCNPDNSDIQTITAKGSRKKTTRLTDAGIEARREFQRGMYGWAIGDKNFFSVQSSSQELMKREEIKRWFSDCTKVLHQELARSNFASSTLQMFGDLSDIGTAATFIDWVDGTLNYNTLHISRYWIDVDHRNNVNRVFFELELTANQLADEFGIKNLPEKIRKLAMDPGKRQMHRVCAYLQKNPNYDPKYAPMIQDRRKYSIDYILATGPEKIVLRTDGFDTFPIAVGRLYRAKNEMYGRSCYMECSSSMALNNDQEYAILRGAQEKASPMWVESADAGVRIVKTHGYTRMLYDPTSIGGAPQQSESRADVGINEHMLERTEERIRKAFLLDAFNPILDHRNMTKYETAQRIGIGLAAVTPPLNKWGTEYATPLLVRSFNLCQSKGKFPEMPDALKETQFEFIFTSKAALALREVELNNTQAFIADQMEIAQMGKPEVLDNIDFDAACQLEHEVYAVPSNILRTEKDVEDERLTRAQAEKERMQAEQAPALADAANKVSQIEE